MGAPPGKESVIYHYNQSRGHDLLLDLLGYFSGDLHYDGFIGYDIYASKKNIDQVGYMAH